MYLCVLQAQQELKDVTFEKEDAMAAMGKLRSVIQTVQTDMADAQQAADRYVGLQSLSTCCEQLASRPRWRCCQLYAQI